MNETTRSVAHETRRWVDQVVIGHNLCPFARAIVDRLRVEVFPSDDLEGLIHCLAGEIKRIMETSADTLPTTLVVMPTGFTDFESYLDVVAMAENIIDDLGYTEDVQIASFHPDYVFDSAETDDPANWTNRSPYPMLHFLRAAEVAFAVETHPDVEAIPERNVSLFRAMGLEQVSKNLSDCYSAEGGEQ